METDNTYTPGLIDKFASAIIKIFLGPIKSIVSKTKPPVTTDKPVDNPSGVSELPLDVNSIQGSLSQKAANLEKGKKLPQLPPGLPAKKIVLGIGIMVFILILLNLILGILKRTPNVGDPTLVPTIVIEPSNPSIYAEDEEVLGLEERINVLDRELSNVVLHETRLRPPELDFNISF